MIAGCPKCSARYRVDAERIGPDGAKLRCTKCSAVFLVRAQKAATPTPPAPPVAERPAQAPAPSAAEDAPAASVPPLSDSMEGAPEPSTPEPMIEVDRERLVLIADPDDARGKASADAVRSWGLQPHLVPDGVEAMLAIQRMLPRAVVLDAALPRMFGFQVCEVVKRNDSLRDTVVVLVGAIHHQSRYRREPSDLYGADVYIEQPDLPDGLYAILREGGLPVEGETSPSTPPQEPAVAAPPAPEPSVAAPPAPSVPEPPAPSIPEPASAPSAEPELEFVSEPPSAPAPMDPVAAPTSASVESTPAVDEDPEKTEERERAERLARIAVSEMLLYQPDKFEQATRDGNLEQVLDLEIQEARALLRQRIREDVRAETDFIMDELSRVAAERSAEG